MTTLIKHFVTFYSPGTFTAEQTTKEIPSWDVDLAVAMMTDIHERHGARPYGFRFTTRKRGPDDFESKQTHQSAFHYVGGKVETLEEVIARNDPAERILRENMKMNDWDRIWTTSHGYRWTQPFQPNDIWVQE